MNLIGRLVLLALFCSGTAEAADDNLRTIAVGSVEVLDLSFEPAPNPLVGNTTVIAIQSGANPRQFTIIPLKKGTTSVVFSQTDGKVGRKLVYNVITNDLSVKVDSIRRLLFDVEGITIEAMDDKVVIDGELLTRADRLRVDKVVGAYSEVLDLTIMSKLVR